VESLKKSMSQLESKIAEYKNKKDMLRARITAAKAQEQIGSMVTNMNSNSAMAAFERMEEKVLMQEARAQSTAELVGADLDSQFARLEGSSDIDDELAALKASILSPAPTPKGELPPAESSSSSQKDKSKSPEPIDAELEELRKQLDKL
jgi:phage shock protein A